MLKITGAAAILYLLYPLTDTRIHYYYKPTIQNKLRLIGCSSLRSAKFVPTPWLANGYLQALFGSTKGSLVGHTAYGKDFEFKRELINLPDGGTVSIDWAVTSASNTNKILLIAPGLTGGSKAQYIRNAIEEAEDYGFTIGVMHGRGIEGTPITTPKINHGGSSDDMAYTIEYVQQKYPNSKLVGLGTSMGAGIMLKYAGEKGEKCGLLGIAAISAPYDLLIVSKTLNNNSFVSNLSDRYLLDNLINLVRLNLPIFNSLDLSVNLNKVMLARSTKEFDQLFTIKMYGYRSTEHYYREVSCVNYLHKITVPVLGLNSLDDPIITAECIPYEEFTHNENLILAVTQTGGHVGWFTGLIRPKRWYAKPAVEFLNRILIENSVEIRYDIAKQVVKI